MTTTASAFTNALPRAWDRTATLLWQPFDLGTWAVLAFAQFLAALPPDFWGGGANLTPSDWSGAGAELETAWEKLAVGGVIVALVLIGVAILVAIAVALVWVSSRAQFVFLDDVIERRAKIVEPWTRLRREGNSLFLFRIALYLFACLLVALAVVTVVSSVGIGALFRGEVGKIAALALAALGALGLLFVPLGYAAFFLHAFVVPIMHRYRLSAIDAWRRFLSVFTAHPLPFLLVGLAVLAAFVAFGITAIVFGLMTCCLGFLLLIAPYLSNLVLLPFTVFYRSFTLEFLAQFDPDLLSRPEAPMLR